MQNNTYKMDKLVLGFICDILYYKKILCHEEIEAIYDAETPHDLQRIIDKIMNQEYNVYKRGEHYEQSVTPGTAN